MGEWSNAGLYDTEPENQEDEVELDFSPADVAAVEITRPFGFRQLVGTSADGKERVICNLDRTDFAILSDLSGRLGKVIVWAVPASAGSWTAPRPTSALPRTS